MKVITKKYKVYKFDELPEHIRENIIDFDFRTMFNMDVISQALKDKRLLTTIRNYIIKRRKRLLYLKNGEVFNG